jgi:predicted N-acyltransferase
MSTYRLELIRHIGEIDPQQWNAVVGDTLQKGYRWQKYKQASQAKGWPPAWTAFITVWSGSDLVGVATAYRYPLPGPFAAPWLRRLAQIALAPTNPVNFLVPPTAAPGVDETAVLPLLIKGIRQLMRRRLAPGARLVFLEEPRHTALLHHLAQSGFLITEGIWENDLYLEWSTFEDYVLSLKSSHRNSLRKQQKKAAQAGIHITTELPTDSATVYALFDKVAQKNHSELLYNPQFLDHAQTILGCDHFKLLRAVHQGRTVACLMMVHDQKTAQLAAIGLDYDLSQTYNLYRVLIYAAIEQCMALGIERIKGGMSRYDIKGRIGFVSRPTQTAAYAWLPPIKKVYSFTPTSLRDDAEGDD